MLTLSQTRPTNAACSIPKPDAALRRLAQLVAVCDVYTWKLLCRDAGLSQHQLATALVELLEALTTPSVNGAASPKG